MREGGGDRRGAEACLGFGVLTTRGGGVIHGLSKVGECQVFASSLG